MLTPLLTKDEAQMMTVQELIVACGKQVDAQYPGITDEEHKDLVVQMFTNFVIEQQKEDLADALIMATFDEVHAELLDATAARLMHPELKDGHPYGYLGVRNAAGEELIVKLQYAKLSDFESPSHLRHRLAYRAVAERLKAAGASTYAEGYELGLFGKEDAHEHGA